MIESFVLHRGVRRGRQYLEVEIDGERYGRDPDHPDLPGDIYDASRLLTDTTDEDNEGVFTTAACIERDFDGVPFHPTRVMFEYGNKNTVFEFVSFSLYDPPDTLRNRIAERITAVRAWVDSIRVPDTEESITVNLPARQEAV